MLRFCRLIRCKEGDGVEFESWPTLTAEVVCKGPDQLEPLLPFFSFFSSCSCSSCRFGFIPAHRNALVSSYSTHRFVHSGAGHHHLLCFSSLPNMAVTTPSPTLTLASAPDPKPDSSPSIASDAKLEEQSPASSNDNGGEHNFNEQTFYVPRKQIIAVS